MLDLNEIEPELDCTQTGDGSELRQKKHKIANPQKRKDNRFSGDTNLLQHKR